MISEIAMSKERIGILKYNREFTPKIKEKIIVKPTIAMNGPIFFNI